ncbi:hypothetical protein R1sor_021268 [Riccia sorocarpa]|uniref:Uncharacterized protein n=1 Tax=Riccia sorocarpa TaxID=122646 RepID=A0ABD3GIF7_9MARC
MEGLKASMVAMGLDFGALQMLKAFALQLQQEEEQQVDQYKRRKKAFHKIVDKHGYFNGWNVSSYLREYATVMKEYQVAESEIIRCFEILTEEFVQPEVADVKRTCGHTWDAYRAGLQRRFASTDLEGFLVDEVASGSTISEVVVEGLMNEEASGLECSTLEKDSSCSENAEVAKGTGSDVEAKEEDLHVEDGVSEQKVGCAEEVEASKVQSLKEGDSADLGHVLDADVKISEFGIDGLQGSQFLFQTDDGKEETGKMGLQVLGGIKDEAQEGTKVSKLVGKEIPIGGGLMATNEDLQGLVLAEGCKLSEERFGNVDPDFSRGNFETLRFDNSARKYEFEDQRPGLGRFRAGD